jgi:hypothetical protein
VNFSHGDPGRTDDPAGQAVVDPGTGGSPSGTHAVDAIGRFRIYLGVLPTDLVDAKIPQMK